MSIESWIPAVGQFLLTLFIAAIGGTWALGKMSQDLNEKIDETKLEAERKVNFRAEGVSREVGETVRAIQQKVVDMELWNRDNFVNKRTFDAITAKTEQTLLRLEDKIDRRFDQIDRKLEKMTGADPH